MSNLGPSGRARRSPGLPVPPRGEPIARYGTYFEAQRAVDFLSDNHFPVQTVTIVGTDLRMVERVTGRLSYGRVAVTGALSGAWFGLFAGTLLSLFARGTSSSVAAAVVLGGGFGMLFALISYSLTGGRRDFTSTSQIVASEYQVLCVAERAQAARELLLRLERQLAPNGAPTASGSAGFPPGPPDGGPGTGRPPASPPPGVPWPGGPSGPPPQVPGWAPAPVPTPPPAEESAPETPPSTPVGLTYGEVMEARRREERARREREQQERAQAERAEQLRAELERTQLERLRGQRSRGADTGDEDPTDAVPADGGPVDGDSTNGVPADDGLTDSVPADNGPEVVPAGEAERSDGKGEGEAPGTPDRDGA